MVVSAIEEIHGFGWPAIKKQAEAVHERVYFSF
jgi:hypothetical protein